MPVGSAALNGMHEWRGKDTQSKQRHRHMPHVPHQTRPTPVEGHTRNAYRQTHTHTETHIDTRRGLQKDNSSGSRSDCEQRPQQSKRARPTTHAAASQGEKVKRERKQAGSQADRQPEHRTAQPTVCLLLLLLLSCCSLCFGIRFTMCTHTHTHALHIWQHVHGSAGSSGRCCHRSGPTATTTYENVS